MILISLKVFNYAELYKNWYNQFYESSASPHHSKTSAKIIQLSNINSITLFILNECKTHLNH